MIIILVLLKGSITILFLSLLYYRRTGCKGKATNHTLRDDFGVKVKSYFSVNEPHTCQQNQKMLTRNQRKNTTDSETQDITNLMKEKVCLKATTEVAKSAAIVATEVLKEVTTQYESKKN